MDSAIFLSTENSVLRAVASVRLGILNKEAAAFCTSHPHKLLIRLKTLNASDQMAFRSGIVACKFLAI
jgi:hypothetical protein